MKQGLYFQRRESTVKLPKTMHNKDRMEEEPTRADIPHGHL